MTHRGLAALAVLAVALGGCILDLGGLTGGPPDGSGGAPGTSSTSGSSASSTAASGGGDGGASVLACQPCPAGGCAAQVLAAFPDVNGPSAIAVTDEGLYWANQGSGTVMRLAAGGPPATLSTASAPTAVAVSAGYAVWAAQDGVYGCAVASCASPVKIAAPTVSGSIQGVAYDGQYVYFTDQGTGASDGAVVRCPPQAGCPARVTLGMGFDLPLGIALLDTQVFWTDLGNGNQNGSVYQSPKGSSAPLAIGTSLNLPTGVAADGTYAYWTEATATGGKVRRCPSGIYCMTPEDLATGLAAPLGLAIGGGRVYWADSGDGNVLSCPSTGCGTASPMIHASGRTGAVAVALGNTCLFWADEVGGGSIAGVGR